MTRFVHHRFRYGAVTVAGVIDEQATTAIVTYGFAFCSPRDQFCRAKGRRIASGRLGKATSARGIVVHYDDEMKAARPNDRMRMIMEDVLVAALDDEDAPSWVKRNAP